MSHIDDVMMTWWWRVQPLFCFLKLHKSTELSWSLLPTAKHNPTPSTVAPHTKVIVSWESMLGKSIPFHSWEFPFSIPIFARNPFSILACTTVQVMMSHIDDVRMTWWWRVMEVGALVSQTEPRNSYRSSCSRTISWVASHHGIRGDVITTHENLMRKMVNLWLNSWVKLVRSEPCGRVLRLLRGDQLTQTFMWQCGFWF